MENHLIYIPRQIEKEARDYLDRQGIHYKVGSAWDEQTMAREIVGCDGVLLRTATLTRRVLEAEPRLKIVARLGVGMDIVDVAAATELGIQVINTPSANAISVAELTIGGMLMAARKLLPLNASVLRDDFFYKTHCQGSELYGKTLGLIGFGNIGRHVARIAHLGLGMEILVYKGHMEGKEVPEYVRLADWEELFSLSDFVSVHVPLRPENAEMIGRREFEMMKPTAFFLNTARGKLVCESELINALAQGEIAGAFLDVFTQEPPAPDNPLLKMDNVVVTPHCGATTKEAAVRAAVGAAEEVVRYFSGKPLRWAVNAPKAPQITE